MDLRDPCRLPEAQKDTTRHLLNILDRRISSLAVHTFQAPPEPQVWAENESKNVNLVTSCTPDSPEAQRNLDLASDSFSDVSVVTPFLVKHINDQSNIPKDNIHKFCYRHNPDIICNKQTDATKMVKIQKELERLPSRDREAISHVWSIFLAAPHLHRALILKGLLSQCCFPQLLTISQEISQLVRIDFIATLPVEIALKVLCYLDCKSLCNAAQVSRKWKQLADDDRVWHHMCEQHIDRKCANCGWGLPLMHMKRARFEDVKADYMAKKRKLVEGGADATPEPLPRKRPWKSVYSERYQLEKNWRNGLHTLMEFVGHTDGVACLQFNRKYLISGLYDSTIKIWNVVTGECIRTLAGHLKGVRALAFDSQKLITGGLDSTIKVWNYHTGQCISTYRGHDDAVSSIDFCNKTIVSGLTDCTIKVWHVDLRTCYTLRGHTDCINCVKIHEPSNTVFSASDDTTVKMWDMTTNQCLRVFGGMGSNGHVGQIETVIPFVYKGDDLVVDSLDDANPNMQHHQYEQRRQEQGLHDHQSRDGSDNQPRQINQTIQEGHVNPQPEWIDKPNYPSHILTSSLDNTIKLWDVKTGKCIRTQFGHIEGIWSISADNFRVVSGSHDKLIKVWDLQNGKCLHTFGNQASVSCVALSSHSVAAGLETGKIKLLNFNCDSSETRDPSASK